MSQIIRVDGAKLLVHTHNDAHQVVEVYELALFLDYAQQHLLRKQILTDWKLHFKVGRDYLLIRNEQALRSYEREYSSRMPGKALRPMKTRRGRLFLLPTGLRQVLLRSSKERAGKLLRSLEQKQIIPREPVKVPRATALKPRGKGILRKSPVLSGLPDVTRTSLEKRREDYAVMQRLLEQLRALEDPHLEILAVQAAETMLGRSLDDLRTGLKAKRAAGPSRSGARPRGPLFGAEGHYSLTQIGRKAGYSAKVAGLAANIVGAKRGHSPEQLRSQKLEFNLFRMWVDQTGTGHELYSFDRDFSNEVLDELRSNPQLKPLPLAPLPDFSGDTGNGMADVTQIVNS